MSNNLPNPSLQGTRHKRLALELGGGMGDVHENMN
jgi:hypothetical protein